MPGIFKKLSANDIKITPFEAHKTYSTTNLSSIGARADFVSWVPYNKFYFNDDNRKYYQIDKLYYRDYVRERAHRLELDDATYTTQERRLYEYANVISLSQKTFGYEVQPGTFIVSCSYSSSGEQFDIRDDGFGNLYDVNRGRDNFPNEDYRIFYLGPVQAFKRANLDIDYKTGKSYVNHPFPDGYNLLVDDDSYFLNEVEFDKVYFVTSSNSGFYSTKTPEAQSKVFSSIKSSVNLALLSSSEKLTVSLGTDTNEQAGSGGSSKLFDGDTTTSTLSSTFAIDDTPAAVSESFTITFDPPLSTTEITTRIYITYLEDPGLGGGEVQFAINGNTSAKQSSSQNLWYINQTHSASFSDFGNELESITYYLSESAYVNTYYLIHEVELDATEDLTPIQPSSSIKIYHQPQFNFETNDDFTISFYYDLNTIDHTNSTNDGDYYILTKEGTKSVPILPSETGKHTSLSATGSSKIGTVPVGPQFPYRIYYKGNYPNANTASLFFERSDGEKTQFVSASFFTSGSTEVQKFIACKNDNGDLKLRVNSEPTTSAVKQNSPTLNKTTSNKANITLYNKPNPNGSYSNFIGYGGGQISQLMMWNQNLSDDEITNISESIVGTPNIGNIFYDNGFAVVTHPSYKNILNNYDFNGYNSVISASISSSALSFSRPSGGTFNNDGTKLILTSDQTDTTVEFTLSTPFDITSFTTSRSFDDPSGEISTNIYSIIFNNDGSKVYLNTLSNDTIRSFSLSSSYDLESRYNKNEVEITAPNGDNIRGIAWNNEGTKFYTTTVNGDINQYISKDPFDLNNISYDYTYNVGHEGNIEGIRFDNSGYRLFIIHTSSVTAAPWTTFTSYVTQYVLDRPFELKSLNENNRFNSREDIYQWGPNGTDDIKYPSDIIFNNDGTKAYIILWGEAGGYEGNGSESDYIWQFDLPQHINKFEYKNTVLITENEYQCTMTEDEFEFTTNTSIRKIPFSDSEDIANFATGSNFKPYVTTVGLYDNSGNLLVVGKLGQPIKASSETDTTFVIRFDT